MLLFLITVNRWLGLVNSSLKNRHLGKCADLGTLGLVLYGLDIREEEVSQDGASVRGGEWLKTRRSLWLACSFLSFHTGAMLYLSPILSSAQRWTRLFLPILYMVPYNVYLGIYCEDTGTQSCVTLP